MKKSQIFSVVMMFVFFAVPILLMMNCSGWNEGTGQVTSCVVDGDFFRLAADFFIGWAMLSSFMLGIPIFLYIGIVMFLIYKAAKFIRSFEK